MILQIIFWACILLIVHSYVIYPLLLELLSTGKKENSTIYKDENELPFVSILITAFNEEKVIKEKIESLVNTQYPADKFEIIIGSDASEDDTVSIIEQNLDKYPQLKLKKFEDRKGKPKVLNDIIKAAKGDILILTDANVFFTRETIYELIKHFKNPDIALTGANIINSGIKKDGISFQEKTYIRRENYIKYLEGKTWGTMMGAFGACYAIRKNDYCDPPQNFIVDDFYITLAVLEKKKKAINELKAICYEDVSNAISEEYRRKVRISSGNFQNLASFKHLLWPPFTGLAFSFFSHKVIRWLGPFLLILIYILNAFLFKEHDLYKALFFIQTFLLLIPFLDQLLKKAGLHLKLFRFVSHFYLMNLALLLGFIKYIKGIESNVWKPTERNQ